MFFLSVLSCDNPTTKILVQGLFPKDSLINKSSPIPTEKPTTQRPKMLTLI